MSDRRVFRTIILATDGSASSERATEAAADLAKELGSELVVVHVLELDTSTGALSYEQADSLLEGVVRRLKDDGASARAALKEAPRAEVADEIVNAARSEGASLIALGTRGLGEMRTLMSGSVTRRTLRLARIPVLVVHG
jgi:nucleotide-binding universal stress UspA family protein